MNEESGAALPPHMTPQQFRELGRRVVDMVADYWERVGEAPVLSRAQPGDIAGMLPSAAPEEGDAWDDILKDIERVVMPGITHWQSPRFFGYFPCNTTGPALLADILSSGLNAQGMLWSTSPAYTEIETRALDWLADLCALPAKFLSASGKGAGVIQGSASEGALVCVLAARERAIRAGASLDRLVAYTSAQAHSSIAKGARIAGLPADRLRLVPTRPRDHSLDADTLCAMMREDTRAGLVPFFVSATVGTTSSGAIDPVRAMADAAREHDAWLHVDAAYAGAAAVCPEFRDALLDGVEHAQSYNFNPHKWLLTTFDCSALWVEDRRALLDALSITPEYLRNRASESGAVIDYRDWQIPLGRRFRALKLWFVLRHYGAHGLRAHIREGVRLASMFERWVREDERFELAAPRSLGLVCFRLSGDDDAGTRTRAFMERLNAGGELFCTHTTLPTVGGGQRFTIRMAIGGVRTTEAELRRAWEAMLREAGG